MAKCYEHKTTTGRCCEAFVDRLGQPVAATCDDPVPPAGEDWRLVAAFERDKSVFWFWEREALGTVSGT